MSKRSSSENGRLPHEVVAAALRERIRSGELSPGTRLPSQQKLVTEFDVNRNVVRHALEALTHEGLLMPRGRGAPPTVAKPAAGVGEPQLAGTELTERLYEAFQAERVTIDAYCLTTETLNNALAEPRRAILDGELAPQSLRVRIIVPDQAAHLALPRSVDDPESTVPLRRLHEIQTTYTQALKFLLGAIRIPVVTFEVRSVAATPFHKLYLLNGTEALFGYYSIVQRNVTYNGEQLSIYDVLGINSPLFRSKEDAFTEHSKLWFEGLWGSIPTPSE